MKYYLICTGDKPVSRPNLKVAIASKVYTNGSPVEVIDGVAECDTMRRFVKAKYIKEITFEEYNSLNQGTVKKSKKESTPKVAVEPTPKVVVAEVTEPEVVEEPTPEVAEEPEVTTPEVVEEPTKTKSTKRSSRRRSRKNKEV